MTNSKVLGLTGEQKAALYLEGIGYTILEQNFRTKYGELDIIAKIDDIIAVVEVKTRSNKLFADAASSVTKKKRRRIRNTTLFWLAINNSDAPIRFDVIEVYLNGQINHITDAFQ